MDIQEILGVDLSVGGTRPRNEQPGDCFVSLDQRRKRSGGTRGNPGTVCPHQPPRTLPGFRSDHQAALDDLFVQVVGMLSAEGLITLERVTLG